MRLAEHAVLFDMGGIPVIGNLETGALVGLTDEGADLVRAMMRRDIDASETPVSCEQLVEYLRDHGFCSPARSSRPHLAYLHVTNRCNLSCAGCYSEDADRNCAPDPELDDLAHAARVLVELGVERLVVSGGEPFARDDLAPILADARTAGIRHISVLTNGTLVTPARLAGLKGLVEVISVSFDGTAADAPAHVRGVQLFDRLVHAVGDIRAAGFAVQILPTIHARNIEDIPAYLELGQRLGAVVGFSLLSGSPARLGGLMCDEVSCARLAELMVSCGATIDDDAGWAASAHQLAARARCGAGRAGVSVAADGTVYPCHMLHDSPYALGCAFTDGAASIREALRAFDLPTVDAIDTCSSCGKRYLCGGGCRARAYRASGSLAGRDPFCNYYNRALEAAIDDMTSRFQRSA